MKRRSGSFLLIILGFWLCASPAVQAAKATKAAKSRGAKPLELTFKFSKVAFQVGEPVEGTIEIDNKFPATIPAAFDIILFHDDQPLPQITTSLKVPAGKTEFTLKQFGIPDFSLEADSVGLWQIKILQKNSDRSYSRIFQIRIHPVYEPANPPAESSSVQQP